MKKKIIFWVPAVFPVSSNFIVTKIYIRHEIFDNVVSVRCHYIHLVQYSIHNFLLEETEVFF